MPNTNLYKRDDALSALAAAEGSLVPGRVDANGAIWVAISGSSITLNGGDASAANQDEQTALLTTIDSDTSRLTSSAAPVAPGAALATTAFVAAGTYNSGGVTLTNGQQSGFQLGSDGRVLVNATGATAGTEYTEGDVDASIAGSAIMWEDTGDTLRAASAAKPLPVTVISGATAGTQYTEADVDASVTGTAVMWEDTSDTMRVASAAKPLPVAVISGAGDATAANQATANASLSVMDDWDETDRAKVNIIVGQAGVAAGAGAVGVTVPRVTLASDDPAVASLSVLDDWDETDRAKVNIIAGQAGVAAGAGAVGATVQRVTLASDDPAVAALGTGNTTASVSSGYLGTIASAIKQNDAAWTATDYGRANLGVRKNTLATLGVADGDYTPLLVDANGALYVQLAGALSAATDEVAIGGVTPAARVSLIDVDETEDEIKATAGTLHSFIITNLATSTRYVRFYNLTAANTTVGTSTIFYGPIAIPAGAGVALPVKIKFSTALCIAATTGVADNDTGAPGANEVVAAVVYS